MNSSARIRAIRAAQVASLSVGLVSTAACSGESNTPDAFVARDASMRAALDTGADTGADAGADAPVPELDAPVTTDVLILGETGIVMTDASEDVGSTHDANCTTFPPTSQECCVLVGGFWDGTTMTCAVAVPGPFVPPAMNA